MTENESIKVIEKNRPTSGYAMLNEALDIAIKALEEVEKYRNIGVVSAYELEQDLLLYKADREILSEYQKLGTVEELKIAKEKRIPKKVIKWADGTEYCPTCGCDNSCIGYGVCIDCGQKLDWSDAD